MELPIGPPVLFKPYSRERFTLLREWLYWCDMTHGCDRHNAGLEAAPPTRLIYVGGPDPRSLSLYLPKTNERVKYIALSHCWGKDPPTVTDPRFCTTNANVEARRESFSIPEDLKTFHDAVRVTRELGIKYLWIDSLCIVQWDLEDWNREARRMERVFASAYCIIAATSAIGPKTGFLTRTDDTGYMHVENTSGRRFYVCTSMDDFGSDVEGSQLNTRAWVMQERVLAQRTIHFSINQAYWECGEGVYCENLCRMKR
jgi:hypothetical protein